MKIISAGKVSHSGAVATARLAAKGSAAVMAWRSEPPGARYSLPTHTLGNAPCSIAWSHALTCTSVGAKRLPACCRRKAGFVTPVLCANATSGQIAARHISAG
jgi:hypothetical protein